jgi:hypothetical protein
MVMVLGVMPGCGGDDTATGDSVEEGDWGEGGLPTSTTGTGGGAGSNSGSATSGDGTTNAATSSGSGGSDTVGVDPCDCMAGGYAPVCGVDGVTYDSICGMECVPVKVECAGECPCAALPCGAQTCAADQPVCTETIGGPAGSRPSYACGPLPATCEGVADPTCDCVVARPGCECMEVGADLFEVTCALP